MHPVLIRISDAITIKSYGVAIAVAFILGIWLSARRAKKVGLNYSDFVDMGFWVMLAAVVGGRFLYVLFNLRSYLHEPLNIIKIWQGGLVFFGGFLVAVAAAIVFMKRRGIPTWLGGDVIAPQIALGYGITRIGCFLNGCCYGKPTSLPWGIKFPDDCGAGAYSIQMLFTGRASYPVHLHPTQLYGVLTGFVFFVILLFIWRRRKFDGQVFWSYVGLYSAYRFGVEFLRGDNASLIAGLNANQILSIVLFGCSVAAWLNLRARGVLTDAVAKK